MKRRAFLGYSSAAGFGLTFGAPLFGSVGRLGANDQVNVAVLGTNGRGVELAKHFAQAANSAVSYICDPDDNAIAKGVRGVEEALGLEPGAGAGRVKAVRDFRRALDSRDVDAVIIATPDHWHAPAALMALQAGKHVYVEKPCGHNGAEGEMLVAAQDRYSSYVIQMGNQRRSSAGVIEAVEQIRSGIIGRVYHAKAWYARKRDSIGLGKEAPVPDHLDYELWQGPAPRRVYKDNVVHYNWHWFWNWGTGESCNNGCHEIDVCRWALGVDYPERVSSSGARHRYRDDWEFWDIQQIGMEFPGARSIFWEGHSVDAVKQHGRDRGAMIFGEKGNMLIDHASYVAYGHDGREISKTGTGPTGDATDTRAPTRNLTRVHCENFLDAIRGRETANSPIDEGHKSVLLCHLGNIAQQVGRTLRIDPSSGRIVGDQEAEKWWGREYEPGWEPRI